MPTKTKKKSSSRVIKKASKHDDEILRHASFSNRVITDGLIGHENIRQYFNALTQRASLAHAYIFSGPPNVGKTSFAVWLARKLLCRKSAAEPCGECDQCRLPADAHPDIALFDDEGELGIGKIRELQSRFFLTTFSGGWRVSVIAGAERLTQEASNALLKFLEEPPSRTLILLTSVSAAGLPQTLRSRTQHIRFGLVSEKLIDAAIKKADPDEKKWIVASAYGRPGIALRLAGDDEFRESVRRRQREFDSFLSADLSGRLSFTSALAEELEASQLYFVLSLWLEILQFRLQSASSEAEIASECRRIAAVQSADAALRANLNKKLAFDAMVINF